MTRTEAIEFLSARHARMTERFPVRMADIPLSLYLRRNLRAAMRIPADVAADMTRHDERVAR